MTYETPEDLSRAAAALGGRVELREASGKVMFMETFRLPEDRDDRDEMTEALARFADDNQLVLTAEIQRLARPGTRSETDLELCWAGFLPNAGAHRRPDLPGDLWRPPVPAPVMEIYPEDETAFDAPSP